MSGIDKILSFIRWLLPLEKKSLNISKITTTFSQLASLIFLILRAQNSRLFGEHFSTCYAFILRIYPHLFIFFGCLFHCVFFLLLLCVSMEVSDYLNSAKVFAEKAAKLSQKMSQGLVDNARELGFPGSDSGAHYFDTSEEKMRNIKRQLDSKNDREKLDGLKRLIAVTYDFPHVDTCIYYYSALDDFKGTRRFRIFSRRCQECRISKYRST